MLLEGTSALRSVFPWGLELKRDDTRTVPKLPTFPQPLFFINKMRIGSLEGRGQFLNALVCALKQGPFIRFVHVDNMMGSTLDKCINLSDVHSRHVIELAMMRALVFCGFDLIFLETFIICL